MPEYHRGKQRSPYRKRAQSFALSHNGPGVRAVPVLIAPTSGLVESKSWRVEVLVPGSSTAKTQGWIGFYRGEDSLASLQAKTGGQLLAQSETFGVVPWTAGLNDHLLALSLVGCTLSIQTNLYIVSMMLTNSSNAVPLLGTCLYAVKDIPA